MSPNWAELADRLVGVLQLATPPVALSFADAPPTGIDRFDAPMSAPAADGRRGRVPAGCVFWAHGTERAFITVPEDHGNCTVGSITHGLLAPADAAGRDDVAELVDAGWVAPGVLDELPRVTTPPGAVIYAPLTACAADDEPDVVLLRVDGRQLMVLSDALPELSVRGKPQCGIVAMAKESGVPAASFGCALSRQRTGMRPDEMTCALPAPRLGPIVEALERASAVDEAVASYAADDARRFGRRP
ncbi:MAG: DUF169 domain-containing protein [Acidimicrobiales bacterium]